MDDASDEIWRDPDGVVHLVAAEGQLPERLEATVVNYLAVGNGDEAFARVDELRGLLDSWHDAALEEAAQALDLPTGEPCGPVDEVAPRPIPGEVAAALGAIRNEPSIGRRLNVLEDALRLVDEWLSYRLDPEKLVGHLILGHGIPTPLASTDHDVLLRQHEHLHR